MRKKEQQLWDTMRRNAPVGWWLQRIENNVGEGMPDVYIVMPNGKTCWVELKAPICPKKMCTRLLGADGLRPSQINWHLKFKALKAKSYILIRDSEKNLFLVDGGAAYSVNGWPLADFNSTKWDAIWDRLSQ